MYVILINKVGQYTTEVAEGLTPVEEYDYLFCGKRKAGYVIARLDQEVKVKVTEEGDSGTVNYVPSKFLPRFPTLEEARGQVKQLASFGHLDTALVRVDLHVQPDTGSA